MRQTTTQLQATDYTLTVTDALLAGQTVTALDGCTATLNGQPLYLPHTFAVGEVLSVTHTRDDTHLSGLTLLAFEPTATGSSSGLPEIDPAQWTYSDDFGRDFLGPDYTTNVNALADARIDAQALLLGPVRIVRLNGSADEFARARLAAAVWNAPDVTVQYDARYQVVNGSYQGTVPHVGVRVVGASKSLEWTGQQLTWGGAVLASPAAAYMPDVWTRTRLTVDVQAGRVQVKRDDAGLIDMALPADYVEQMGGQGLVELFDETNPVTANFGGSALLRVDQFAVRAGNGSAQGGGGAVGSGAARLGSVWRFGPGVPDDTVGVDGDVWMVTTTSALYQRVAGQYQAAGNLRGLPGEKGDKGEPGTGGGTVNAEPSIARLSDTSLNVLPAALPSYQQPPVTYANQPYGVLLTAAFETTHAFPVEGLRLSVTSITGGTLTGAYLSDANGDGVDLGEAICTADPNFPEQMTVRFPRGRNLPPGAYTATLNFSPDTIITAYPAQRLIGGMTSLVSHTTSNNLDRAIGAQLSLIVGAQTVVGRLDPSGMNTVTTPSDHPSIWYDRAVEIVYPVGSVPYLRTRHEGQNYRLDLVLDAPPPSGGEAS